MTDAGKGYPNIPPLPSGKPEQAGSPVATTVQIGSIGGLMLYMVNQLPESISFKPVLLYISPFVAAGLTVTLRWGKGQLDRWLLERVFHQRCKQTRLYLERQYANPNLSDEERAKLDALHAALLEQEHNYYLNRIQAVPYHKVYTTPFGDDKAEDSGDGRDNSG